PLAARMFRENPRTEAIDLTAIPFRIMSSLEAHRDRRDPAMRALASLGLTVRWKIPVPIGEIDWSRLPSIYRQRPNYASHALTTLAIFDEVERSGAAAFLHFEDDIVLHPRITEFLMRIRVPRDWQFIYLGGRNNGKRRAVSPGLAQSDCISDLHAVIMRSTLI